MRAVLEAASAHLGGLPCSVHRQAGPWVGHCAGATLNPTYPFLTELSAVNCKVHWFNSPPPCVRPPLGKVQEAWTAHLWFKMPVLVCDNGWKHHPLYNLNGC